MTNFSQLRNGVEKCDFPKCDRIFAKDSLLHTFLQNTYSTLSFHSSRFRGFYESGLENGLSSSDVCSMLVTLGFDIASRCWM